MDKRLLILTFLYLSATAVHADNGGDGNTQHTPDLGFEEKVTSGHAVQATIGYGVIRPPFLTHGQTATRSPDLNGVWATHGLPTNAMTLFSDRCNSGQGSFIRATKKGDRKNLSTMTVCSNLTHGLRGNISPRNSSLNL